VPIDLDNRIESKYCFLRTRSFEKIEEIGMNEIKEKYLIKVLVLRIVEADSNEPKF